MHEISPFPVGNLHNSTAFFKNPAAKRLNNLSSLANLFLYFPQKYSIIHTIAAARPGEHLQSIFRSCANCIFINRFFR